MTDGEPLLSRSERIVRDEERLKSFRRDNPHWSVVAAELEPLMMEAANRGELSEACERAELEAWRLQRDPAWSIARVPPMFSQLPNEDATFFFCLYQDLRVLLRSKQTDVDGDD